MCLSIISWIEAPYTFFKSNSVLYLNLHVKISLKKFLSFANTFLFLINVFIKIFVNCYRDLRGRCSMVIFHSINDFSLFSLGQLFWMTKSRSIYYISRIRKSFNYTSNDETTSFHCIPNSEIWISFSKQIYYYFSSATVVSWFCHWFRTFWCFLSRTSNWIKADKCYSNASSHKYVLCT